MNKIDSWELSSHLTSQILKNAKENAPNKQIEAIPLNYSDKGIHEYYTATENHRNRIFSEIDGPESVTAAMKTLVLCEEKGRLYSQLAKSTFVARNHPAETKEQLGGAFLMHLYIDEDHDENCLTAKAQLIVGLVPGYSNAFMTMPH